MAIIRIYLYMIAFNIVCILLGEMVLRYKLLMAYNDISPITALKNICKLNNTIKLKTLLELILVPFSALIILIQFFLLKAEDLKKL